MSEFKLTGEKLAKTVLNQIIQHPETWRQSEWHSSCGTKHCFAGWCQMLSGRTPDAVTARRDAKAALGLSDADASWYFRGECTLGELYSLAANFNRAGFNRDGFNRDGFNRAGFDRDGFDRDGFNRAGFDRDGFDRDGEKLKLFDL